MHDGMRALHPLRRSAALLLLLAIPALPHPAAADTAPVVDGGLTAVLRSALDAHRSAAGLDPLFSRPAYQSQAAGMAKTLAGGGSVRMPADGTPASWLTWTVPTATLASDNRDAANQLADALDTVLRYPLHTDGGWAVAVSYADGEARIGLAALVGWPDPAIGANRGCGSGWCWEARGVNPHLPWTRNRLLVHLASGAPSAADSLVRSAIARINGVAGFGPDVVYGGRVSATSPGPGHRFLIRWESSSACGSSVRGCTVTDYQGTYQLIFGARISIISGRYAADPNPERWIGTLAHELGHALGLGHYESSYGGSYQLMRSSSGPNAPQSGDAAGLRTLDRSGSLWTRVTADSDAYPSGSTVRMTVRTSSSGFGGVRSVAIQCVDRFGHVQTPVRRTGIWDIRGMSVSFSWTAGEAPEYATSCRSLITSKASRAYSPWIPVTFGG
jgi:hypothetical protein